MFQYKYCYYHKEVNELNKITYLDLQTELLSMFTPSSEQKEIHYLNDSKTWYMTPEQGRGYIAVHDSEQYASGMFDSEYCLLQKHSSKLMGLMPDNFTYLDLGPGAGKKSKLILNEAIALEKTPFYGYVDVSSFILGAAAETLQDLNLEQKPFLGNFVDEDNLSLMKQQLPNQPKFVYLGSTFANYEPNCLLYTFRHFLNSNDVLYVSMQEKPENIDSLLEQYSVEAYPSGFLEGLSQLGLHPKQLEVRYSEKNQRVENYVVIEKVPSLLENYVKEGDKIVFFTSRKTTRDNFEKDITLNFAGDFFYENGFMAFAGKRNEIWR